MINWPDLKIPPLNLWNIYPSKEQLKLYDELKKREESEDE